MPAISDPRGGENIDLQSSFDMVWVVFLLEVLTRITRFDPRYLSLIYNLSFYLTKHYLGLLRRIQFLQRRRDTKEKIPRLVGSFGQFNKVIVTFSFDKFKGRIFLLVKSYIFKLQSIETFIDAYCSSQSECVETYPRIRIFRTTWVSKYCCCLG
jgi:hypothetical protein